MRTVHTYIPTQEQQQQQQQQQHQQQQQQQQQTTTTTSSSSSSSSTTTNQHSTTNGYPSVRHSLLRMHSQLRSANNRRETSQAPLDLSLYRTTRQTPKMATRSTNTTNNQIHTIPIVAQLAPTQTHTIYSNAVPITSTCSKTSTSMIRHEQNSSTEKLFSTNSISKCSSSQNSRPTPKLAYSYSNIDENLQCPLCIDRLRDPRALPCQHVFCCACLKSIPSSNLPYPTIACPLCRRTFPYKGADQFPVSYIHRQLLDLIPQNYDINGKCTKCQEKTSLILCSCCDYLLCQKCFNNDREKILDNIQHIVKTCYFRLTRINTTRDQINKLNEINRRKINQVETIFENFQKKFFQHKQSILNSLNKFNEQIHNDFWSKLNLSTLNSTEPFVDILQQADNLLTKSNTVQFNDILSLFYNLNSIDEQLERANTLIDTYDVQNLLKQNIEINENNDHSNDQIFVKLNQIDNTENILPIIPTKILSRPTKRLRKTEPKRHIEIHDDDDDDDTDVNSLEVLKRMKVEYSNELNFEPISSPTDSLLCLSLLNNDQQQNDLNDDDVIYVTTISAKSPTTLSFEELFK